MHEGVGTRSPVVVDVSGGKHWNLLHSPTMDSEREGIQVLQCQTAAWNVEGTVDLYNAIKKYFEYTGNIRNCGRHRQLMWKTVLNHYLRKGGG